MIVYHGSFKLAASVQNDILNNPIANDGVNGNGFWVSSNVSHTEVFGNVAYAYEFPDELLEQCTHKVTGGSDTWAIPSKLTSKLVPLCKTKCKMFRVDKRLRKGFVILANEPVIPNAPFIHLSGGNTLSETFLAGWVFDDIAFMEGLNEVDANAGKFGQDVNICIDAQMIHNFNVEIYPAVRESFKTFAMKIIASAEK